MRARVTSLVALVGGFAFLLSGLLPPPLDWHRLGSPAFANSGGGNHGNGNSGGGNGNGGGNGGRGGGNGNGNGGNGGGNNSGGGTGNGGNGRGGGNGNGGNGGNGKTSGTNGSNGDGGNGNAGGNGGGTGSNDGVSGNGGAGASASSGAQAGTAVPGGSGVASTNQSAAAGKAPTTVVTGALSDAADNRPSYAPDAIVAAGLSERALLRLRERGFRVGGQSTGRLSAGLVQLILPKGMSPEAARRIVSSLDRSASVDLDSYYYTDGSVESACSGVECSPPQMIGWTATTASACGGAPVIGLVDTAIDRHQPALTGQSIELIEEPGGGAPSSPAHGTAIAALLVGRSGSTAEGLLPGARLIAVDAFNQAGDGERTDVTRLVRALETLSDRGVRVINLSLSGPPNKLLEAAIAAAIARDIVVVAAAGNKGPGAEPAYPAAYPGVVAVTAVDRHLQIYARATHGEYIGLAAPGVDVWTASVPEGAAPRSGTSYAVPFVSAAAATLTASHPHLAAALVRHTLYAAALDLGGNGHDSVFGWGLVQAGGLCGAPVDQADARSTVETESATGATR